jgi:hypothetical protein
MPINRLLLAFVLMTTSPMGEAQVWATAVSNNQTQGTAILYRFVMDFHRDFEPRSQPDRVIISWAYQGQHQKGMPSAEEHARMGELEDALEPVEANGFASLVLVSTGDNLKEWTYYTRSADQFLERLNLVLRGKPGFPIEIHTAADPAWTTYHRFVGGLKK